MDGSESERHKPLLSPSGPRRIRHSSICPNAENMTRMSFSLHFFDTMPMNNFLSSTATGFKKKKRCQGIGGLKAGCRVYGSMLKIFMPKSPNSTVKSVCFFLNTDKMLLCACAKRKWPLHNSTTAIHE